MYNYIGWTLFQTLYILKQLLDNLPSLSMSDRLRLIDYLFRDNPGSLSNIC